MVITALLFSTSPAFALHGPSYITASDLKNLLEKAGQGDENAQVLLGNAYVNGHGAIKRDYAEAAKWLRRAAEQGDPVAIEAYLPLAGLYATGRGVPQDWAEAYFWYSLNLETPREQGYLKMGLGTPEVQLRDEAAKHLTPEQIAAVKKRLQEWNPTPSASHLKSLKEQQEKAEHGEIEWYGALGQQSELGFGMKPNYPEAAKWYRKGADAGDQGAQFHLGSLYFKGLGVPQDYAESYFWLFLSSMDAERYSITTDFRMRDEAERHLTAAQIAAIERRANEWRPNLDVTLLKARAEAGVMASQWTLARVYSEGLGEKLPQNFQEAYFWFALQAIRHNGISSGPDGVHKINELAESLRDTMATHLTSEQKADADKRVDAWMKAHPAGPPVVVVGH